MGEVEVPTADTTRYSFKQNEAVGTNGETKWSSSELALNTRMESSAVKMNETGDATHF